MSMHSESVREVFLDPGGFFFGGSRERVRTLLGSCVAITLWHPRMAIGGMAHFMLPSRSAPSKTAQRLDARYADEALALFRERMAVAGTRPEDYEAKLFGGANMFPGIRRNDPDCVTVSCRNVQVARRMVQEHGFTLAAEHLGGTGHRSLVFDLQDGAVYLKHRPPSTTGTA